MSATIQEAIEDMEARLCNFRGMGHKFHPKVVAILELTIEALREKLARENPEPLTLAELRQMNGELVWLEVIDPTEKWLPDFSDWARVYINEISEVWFDVFGNDIGAMPEESNHGKTWNAYRHKPKEEKK